MNKEQKRLLIADFRYSIIADLCNPYIDRAEYLKILKQKTSREYDIPFSKKRKISEDTIRRWIRRFKNTGKQGLEPSKRSDYGRSRCLSLEEQSCLINYLEQYPEISAINAVRTLQKQGKIKNDISQSSLSRFIVSNKLKIKDRRLQQEQDINLKFEFFKPLECVQADVMHAFKVRDKKGKKRKALLLAFIDDATRRILYSSFTFSEKALEFERGIKHILQAHGRIGKLYVDNGSTFTSSQTKRILDILGIVIVHSKPYRPAGRGKIERFFRTVRDQFIRVLDPEKIKSIGQLNSEFKIWLESEYHRSPHRGLNGKPPLEVWLSKTQHIIPVSPHCDLDQIFLHEEKRKVYKDSTITLFGQLYQAPPILAGKSVKIRFNPFEPITKIIIIHDGKNYGKAKVVDSFANTKVKRCIHTKTISYGTEDSQNTALAVLHASRINKGDTK